MAYFTLEQVQKHSKPDDIWIVLHNKGWILLYFAAILLLLTILVYNVTKYLNDHPGGKDILLEVAGTDATEAFEEVGHSDEAREQLEPFYVGDLPAEVRDPFICSLGILTSWLDRNKLNPSRSTVPTSNKSRSPPLLTSRNTPLSHTYSRLLSNLV